MNDAAPPRRVLITDDFLPNRRILRQALKATDLEILEAENGLQTLDMALELGPDVILLDVKMPDMDGYEVCRRLKDDPKTQSIPVLLVTAYAEDEDRQLGLQAGANDFVAKPVDGPDLVLRIRNALLHRQEKERLQAEVDLLKSQETLRNNMIQFVVNDLNIEFGELHQSLETVVRRLTGQEHRDDRSEILIAQDRLVNLLSTTDRLLGLRRLEAHESPYSPQGCDLLDTLDEVLELLRLEPGEDGLDVRISSDVIMVLADPDLLPKVLRNLISLAREIIPEISEQRITIEPISADSLYVRLTIRVGGVGIIQVQHHRALERFEVLDSATACDSCFELGLAFSKLAVEAQGGVVNLKMTSDNSFTIEVTLPAFSDAQASNLIHFPTPLRLMTEPEGIPVRQP